MTEAKHNPSVNENKIQEEEQVGDDEIPPITYRDKVEQKSRNLKNKELTDKKIVEFFIADLFNAQIISKQCFTFKNLTFRAVKVRGIVVEVNPVKDKVVITVDDSTGQIDCYLERNLELALLKKNVQELEDSFINTGISVENVSTVERGIQLMIRATQKNLQQIPEVCDFKLGDEVELIGNLSEFNNRRNIFVNHIVKENDLNNDFHDGSSHMKHLLDLYNNFYVR